MTHNGYPTGSGGNATALRVGNCTSSIECNAI